MLIALPQRKLIIECFAVSLRRFSDHYIMRVETKEHGIIELPGLFTEEEANDLFWGTVQALREQDGFISIDTSRLREGLEGAEE
jgi:hypothetical protein